MCLDGPEAAALIIGAVCPNGWSHRCLWVAMLKPVKDLASHGGLLHHVLVCGALTQCPRVWVHHGCAPEAEEIQRGWLMLKWVVLFLLVLLTLLVLLIVLPLLILLVLLILLPLLGLRRVVPGVPRPGDVPALH